MSEDSPDWFGDYSDRHIRVDAGYFEVVVKDDEKDLGEIEETAYRVMEKAEETVERMTEETDSDGMHH